MRCDAIKEISVSEVVSSGCTRSVDKDLRACGKDEMLRYERMNTAEQVLTVGMDVAASNGFSSIGR